MIFKAIKKNEEFQNIFDKGHSIYGKYLVVYFLQNHSDDYRFGFCVGKKIGGAVVRNRIKRLFREAVRQQNQAKFITGWDLVIIARHPVLKASLTEIVTELQYILAKFKSKYLTTERE